jgi:predicted glycogen debranching enzyme
MNFQYGREICNHLPLAASREWLVTNGIGGYASGTISGILTRRYHGLLVAALKPPVARTLLLTKLEETVAYNGQLYDLSANLWADGTVAPQGHLNIESFSLEGTTPVWHFAFADGLLEKRIWMQQGENTTYIHYSYLRGSQPLILSLKTLLNYRDHHQETKGKSSFSCQIKQQNLIIQVYPDAPKLYLSAVSTAQNFNLHWETNNTWYRNFALAVEKERGLNDTEDHFLGATGKCILQPGASLTIIATTENNTLLDTQVSLTENSQTVQKLRDLWSSSHSNSQDSPPWIEQLVLAADQFIVNRSLPNNPEGKTIIAGYPWFTDWGRDTMIALPGLTLATGRYDIAKTILCTFAEYIDRGMLPNVFPDAGETPHYNTVDATLWYLEAIRAYYAATEDRELIAQLFPLITDIIDWHIKGTRHNIQMDDDGLLYAGEAGVQLTWMDAKVKDWVVTPRIGKPVEINALWYNALVCLNYFAAILDKSSSKYQAIAEKTRAHFAKFWYQEGSYCYDVIDSPTGNDPSFRPNQIFAVSLPSKNFDESLALLQTAQQKMVVDKVAQKLLTSYGLRSLSTDHLNYTGIYSGNLLKRDASYHQGTTWSWLIGHFVQAHLQVYNNPQLARSFLLPIADHLNDAAIGNISEIFDGDTPFSPRGCFAQAWSVAEVLRSWKLTSS